LGVPDKTIQAILRHANVNTTLTMYVKSVPTDSIVAMQKLERALGNKWATAERKKVAK
jgi:integrase